jgi:hypothetical protein
MKPVPRTLLVVVAISIGFVGLEDYMALKAQTKASQTPAIRPTPEWQKAAGRQAEYHCAISIQREH